MTLTNQTKVWLLLLLALSQGADLLILDEPTTALDPVSVDQFLHALAEDGLYGPMTRSPSERWPCR